MSSAKAIQNFLIDWTNSKRLLMEQRLDDRNSNATGNLRASLEWRVRVTPTSIECILEAADYWAYIDMGVKGVESGESRGGFQFKTIFPNRKMIDSLQKWIAFKGIPIRQSETQSTQSVIAQARKAAGGMSVNIKKRGITATMFFSDNINQQAFEDLTQAVMDQYGKEVFMQLP